MKTTRIQLDLTDVQIVKLRELMDSVPLSGYHDLILPILKALPLESADCPPSVADARPAQNSSERGRGFKLVPFTPRGAAAVQEIEQQLARLPHTGDSL